jgi:hypothetical protein
VAEALIERLTTAGELDRSHAMSPIEAVDTASTNRAPATETASITCSDVVDARLVPG